MVKDLTGFQTHGSLTMAKATISDNLNLISGYNAKVGMKLHT